MSYYLGIDGGGTKTKVAVINDHNQVIYIGNSGPSSIDTVTSEETLLAFEKALEPLYQANPDITFKKMFAGIGGIVSDRDMEHVERLLKRIKGAEKSAKVRARNDMENALYSGLCFDEGISLICGTGMVAFGLDTHGNKHKAGGWSYKEGDAGSAYDLGNQALKAMIRSYDGRYPMSPFTEEIASTVGLKKAMDIVEIYNTLDRTSIARLAPIVTKYAGMNDPIALKIVETATDELKLAVQAVYNQLKLNDPQLVIVGSLGNAEGIYSTLLHTKIKSIDPRIRITKPIIDPAEAAAMMAKRI